MNKETTTTYTDLIIHNGSTLNDMRYTVDIVGDFPISSVSHMFEHCYILVFVVYGIIETRKDLLKFKVLIISTVIKL